MTKPCAQASESGLVDDQAIERNPHDLEAHMDELRRIDAVRKKSAALRTDGHKALLAYDEIHANVQTATTTVRRDRNEDDGVPERDDSFPLKIPHSAALAEVKGNEPSARSAPIEPADKANALRVTERGTSEYAKYRRLRVQWQYSRKEDKERTEILQRIEKARADFHIQSIQDDYAPVLAAAETVRAFVSVGYLAIGKETMQAWYLVVRELFTAAKPDWTIGGARAGEGGWITAYATAQCVTAICDLADVLERSAELLMYMQGISDQLLSVNFEAIPEAWRQRDAERLERDLLVTLASMSNATVFNLPDPDPGNLNLRNYLLRDFKGAVRDALLELKANFVATLESVKSLRDAERNARTKEEAEGKSNEEHRRFAGSATGHAIARAAVDIGQRHNNEALAFLDDATPSEAGKGIVQPPDGGWMRLVANRLKAAAHGVRSGAGACRGYLSSVIDRQIAANRPTDNRTWDPGELAFALSAYVMATGSEQESAERYRLRLAASLVCADLSADGTISNRMSFHAKENRQYSIQTEELLGAVADVVRLTRHPINERLAATMHHYFDRQCAREGQTKKVWGWFSEFDHFRETPSLVPTIDAVESLGAFNRMLDEGINDTILEHFTVRLPNASGVRLENLFYPDYGFKDAGVKDDDGVNRIKRDSVALTMQKMRAHVLRTGGDTLHSLVLHGPGGTGKTTLIEALANSCNVPLVEVTPSDIVKSGEADIEKRARAVFESLSMLSKVVILFDEFDPVLRRRDPKADGATTIYSFLTPGMLPKLKALNESAKARRVAYALMTNLIGSLDVPAVRKGRFDEAIGIYPPDPLSRAGYMAKLCNNYAAKKVSAWNGSQYRRDRFVELVRRTKGVGMTPITAKGWFRLDDNSDLTRKPIGYILGMNNDRPEVDDPEEVWKGQLGNGPFAEKESRQWEWLTKWEESCPVKDGLDDETFWLMWLIYLKESPVRLGQLGKTAGWHPVEGQTMLSDEFDSD